MWNTNSSLTATYNKFLIDKEITFFFLFSLRNSETILSYSVVWGELSSAVLRGRVKDSLGAPEALETIMVNVFSLTCLCG